MKRVILVTGGSKGIGRAICLSFMEKDNIIVVSYNKSKIEAEQAVKEISERGAEALAVKADVTDYGEVKAMIDNTVNRYEKIDVLVNNAGMTKDGFLMLMPEKDWEDVLAINLGGVFNCSKAVSGHMIAQKNGIIINISSLSGITGLAGQTNYSAAKGGVIAFTKALAKELAPFNIRVNAVAPGVIETDIIDSLSEKIKKGFLENIPLKRFGKPADVANVVKFLASPDAGYITGEVIRVTGGL